MGLEGRCHCGATGFMVTPPPVEIRDCGCELCRKQAALWVACRPSEVRFVRADDQGLYHSGGARVFCRGCGCVISVRGHGPDEAELWINRRLLTG